MPTHRISYIAAVCLLLIFATQAYLVNDYFQTTRASLTRETNAIIEDAFRKELNQRHKIFKHLIGEDTITVIPPQTKANTVNYDLSKMNDYTENVLSLLDLAINNLVSKFVPMNLHNLDSLTGTILQSRNIDSEYVINVVDPATGKVVAHSDKKVEATLLLVPSKLLQVDVDKTKSLQLVLVNPFGLIITRMSLMLLSSLVLSIICVLAFRLLMQILAEQKQLVAFKNEFLASIAHELKRPVASLSFNLDCLGMPAFRENPQQHALLVSRSVNATEELNDTINMIVDLSKLEEGLLVLNNEAMNLTKLVEDLKHKFSSNPVKEVKIQTICEPQEVSVVGDPRLLSQCFANLIDNAIKYSNEEVLIVITLRKTGGWIIISVKDNGYGIQAEKLPMIFDKYTRAHTDNTKINGFGIGLNYVKTIVEKHQGAVEVKSRQGEGSEFSVLLPC